MGKGSSLFKVLANPFKMAKHSIDPAGLVYKSGDKDIAKLQSDMDFLSIGARPGYTAKQSAAAEAKMRTEVRTDMANEKRRRAALSSGLSARERKSKGRSMLASGGELGQTSPSLLGG